MGQQKQQRQSCQHSQRHASASQQHASGISHKGFRRIPIESEEPNTGADHGSSENSSDGITAICRRFASKQAGNQGQQDTDHCPGASVHCAHSAQQAVQSVLQIAAVHNKDDQQTHNGNIQDAKIPVDSREGNIDGAPDRRRKIAVS